MSSFTTSIAPTARAFVEAAAQQLEAAAAAGSVPDAAGIDTWRDRVLAVLRLAEEGDAPTTPAAPAAACERLGERLVADPLLLSVFFGNVDLLYADGYAAAEVVGAAIMHAIALSEPAAAETVPETVP